ncbi:MAG: hypothetical protein IV093_21075 [Rubrivivax sp.]|nr:hypothetical protein [Rubrivivax sp.]
MTSPEAQITVDGRIWPVVFRGAAIDPYGWLQVDRWLAAAMRGGDASEAAVARLCEIATDGALRADDVLVLAPSRADTVPGLYAGWMRACYGEDRRPWLIRKLFPRRHENLAALRARLGESIAQAQADIAQAWRGHSEAEAEAARLAGDGSSGAGPDERQGRIQ